MQSAISCYFTPATGTLLLGIGFLFRVNLLSSSDGGRRQFRERCRPSSSAARISGGSSGGLVAGAAVAATFFTMNAIPRMGH